MGWRNALRLLRPTKFRLRVELDGRLTPVSGRAGHRPEATEGSPAGDRRTTLVRQLPVPQSGDCFREAQLSEAKLLVPYASRRAMFDDIEKGRAMIAVDLDYRGSRGRA
jgi:hypothetical protein